jgi:asparagine N-glycosylation enzyme membrane subunit Stt3
MKHRYILLIFLSFSFLIHTSIYFALPTNQYNFYDTDSWYPVRQIDRISHGENYRYDEMLNYPVGREIDWGITLPVIGSFAVNHNDFTLNIFNKVGFLSPILSLLFTFILYFLISRLFSPTVGLYTAILLSIGTGIYFQNCVFGIIDHHLIESALFTISIISIILMFEKKPTWGIVTIASMALLFFTSTIWTLYWCLIFICALVFILGYVWSKNRLAIGGVVGIVATGGYYFNSLLSARWTSLWNWIEPISEISYSDPLLLITRFNILLVPIFVGLSMFVVSTKKIEEIALVVITILLFILTLRFTRMEYIFYPVVVILSAYYIDRYFSIRNVKIILSVFVVASVVLGGIVISGMVDDSNNNRDWDDGLEYLKQQPEGVVLSWWDYGHWIVAVGEQPPFADPFQGNVNVAAKIFTSARDNGGEMVRASGIKYIVVTKDDYKFYGAMKWYCVDGVSYEDSYLKYLIGSGEPVFEKGKIRIFVVDESI